ncbi:uncharacterized protein LOC123886622 [Trifolium pratense]|uniref:uncharacterized protein LOC123886622 n=1 Tax=Trifolium pratense TaxID=57577 RepID=UPI001E69465F|nr:uncharacterized protein LOC123886622 [Trifolium pratense]
MKKIAKKIKGKRKQRYKKSAEKKGPRTGEAYQAEIPPLTLNYDCNYSLEIPNETLETNNFYKYSNDTWNKIEEASLMLGLYIFGKNFAQVKRFIGSKTIGDIQTFYYTKFYKSEDHKRWKVYRKAREEKYVYRQTLFTTPTHQYLLSRLLNKDYAECCEKLLQDFKNFQENKWSLEDYVIALKDLVGLEALVNVVGIGKEDDLSNLTANSMKDLLAKVVTHPELIKDLASQNGSNESNYVGAMYLDKGSTTVNDFAEIKFDDHENQFSDRHVETLRKSRRLPKPSTKALEAVVDKYKEKTSCKGRRDVETLKKSRRPEKPSMKALEAAVDKYKEETSCKSRRGVETLRKSRRSPKPSTKALEALVDKYEKEKSCKRRQDVETLRKSRRSRKPSMKALEAVVDKYEEEASCKRRRDAETLRKSSKPSKPSMKALEAAVDKYEEVTSCKKRRDAETLRKSRRPPKPSTKALEAVVDKYEEETSCKRRRV